MAPGTLVSRGTGRDLMNDPIVKASRGIGWILLIIGLVMALGAGLYLFFFSSGMLFWEKVILFAIYGGLAVLLFSVLRQRLIERKTDKYKDVAFGKVDVDDNSDAALDFEISAVPTFVIFEGEHATEKWSGADEEKLERHVKYLHDLKK